MVMYADDDDDLDDLQRRPSLVANWTNLCGVCRQRYERGDMIRPAGTGPRGGTVWGHAACVEDGWGLSPRPTLTIGDMPEDVTRDAR